MGDCLIPQLHALSTCHCYLGLHQATRVYKAGMEWLQQPHGPAGKVGIRMEVRVTRAEILGCEIFHGYVLVPGNGLPLSQRGTVGREHGEKAALFKELNATFALKVSVAQDGAGRQFPPQGIAVENTCDATFVPMLPIHG